jgi:hypothetical protein
MRKYEYIDIQGEYWEPFLDKLDNLGEMGYRVIHFEIQEGPHYLALMERSWKFHTDPFGEK